MNLQPAAFEPGAHLISSDASDINSIPLVIIAFRKKDGGISGCSKKSAPRSGRFFDNRYKEMMLEEYRIEGLK
jgi:hypothetical protein